MLIYGVHYDILGGLTPLYVPAWRRIQTTSSRYRVYDYGIANDVRVANITIRGTESDMSGLYDSLVEPDTISINFEGGEYVFGTDVDYTSALSVESSGGAFMQAVNVDTWEITFEIKIKNPTLITSKATSFVDACIGLQFDSYYERDIINESSMNNGILNEDHGKINPKTNIVVSGDVNEIGALKNYFVQDVRIDNSFTVPNNIFPDSQTSATIVNIQEQINSITDAVLTIEAQALGA